MCRLFDRVLLLQQGALVYFGLNGEPALNYFCQHYQKVPFLALDAHLPPLQLALATPSMSTLRIFLPDDCFQVCSLGWG